MRKPRKASALGVKLEDGRRLLELTRFACLPLLRHLCRCGSGSPDGQRGAFTGSRLTSESSLEKLKSVGTLPVINRAPRLNVRSCIAHCVKTRMRLWNETR